MLNELAEASFTEEDCYLIFVSAFSILPVIRPALPLRCIDHAVLQTIIDLRLGYPPDKWRNVYKVSQRPANVRLEYNRSCWRNVSLNGMLSLTCQALTVLEFILKRGSKTWVTLAVREMVPKLEGLETFEFRDEKGHDQARPSLPLPL